LRALPSVQEPVSRNLQLAVLLPLVIALGVFATYWDFSRARAMLERWAQRNGFHIVGRHYSNLSKGPFFWTTSRGQVVYRITVEAGGGVGPSGWARCGGWFLGMLSDRVQVVWDDADHS